MQTTPQWPGFLTDKGWLGTLLSSTVLLLIMEAGAGSLGYRDMEDQRPSELPNVAQPGRSGAGAGISPSQTQKHQIQSQ